MEQRHKNNEIDLLALLLKGVNIIRENFWLVVVFFCIGTGLGLAYYYSTEKVYESKMVISSGILTKSYSKYLIDQLIRHRRESNTNAIVDLLDVSEKTAVEIAYLEIESVSKFEDQKEADRFIITAGVLDPKILPDLQKGLVHFLENNEFAKVRVAQNKNYFKEMIAKVNIEIKDMEEWKQKILNGTFFQTLKGGVMFDPTTVNSKILELTKEKITLENNLALVNSVQVIEGFTIFEKPSSPKLSVSLISGSVVGLLFVSLLIAFKSIRKILSMADAARKRP